MRKEIIVNLEDGGENLQFKIKQMPAVKLESWLMRAVLLLARGGDAAGIGSQEMPDFQQVGDLLRTKLLTVIGGLNYGEAKPLLDEMLTCCTLVRGNAEIPCTENLLNDVVQDVKTLFLLRKEAIQLNLGFLKREVESGSTSPAKLNIGKPQRNTAA